MRFELFGLRIQVHGRWVPFYARAQRIWQSSFVIINPQTGNGAGVWMSSCPEEMVLGIWGFWKRVSWDWTIEARVGYSAVGSWILTVERCNCVFRIATDRNLKHNKMHPALEWGQHRMVSIDFKNCVSLLVSPWTEARS